MNIAILISIILVIINQFILSKNQSTITGNQKKIAETLDEINKEVHR
jgi:F0F1-type ATP synthase membrane subunit b/b'